MFLRSVRKHAAACPVPAARIGRDFVRQRVEDPRGLGGPVADAGSAGGSGIHAGSPSDRAVRRRAVLGDSALPGSTDTSAWVYGCRGAQHLLDGADLDDPAQVHDGDPVGDVPRQAEIVADDQRGQRQRVPQIAGSGAGSRRAPMRRATATGSSATITVGFERERAGDDHPLAAGRRTARAGSGRRTAPAAASPRATGPSARARAARIAARAGEAPRPPRRTRSAAG